MFTLVALSFFWAATDYAAAVGSTRARQFASELSRHPDAIIYSERDLQLEAAGAVKSACRGRDPAYRYRYEGLKLMLRSENRYFFLPSRWSRADGRAIVIPESDSLRFEFSPAQARGRAPIPRRDLPC